MDVKIKLEHGDEKHLRNITLAEQTSQRVYIENEELEIWTHPENITQIHEVENYYDPL